MNKTVDSTKLSHIERTISKIRRDCDNKDVDISFEFVCMNFFPSIWNNIQKKMADEHMAGYLEGLEAAKEENK